MPPPPLTRRMTMPVQRGGDQAYTGPMQRTRSVVQGGMLGPDRDGESLMALSHPSSTSAGGDDRENIVVVPSAGAGSSSSFGAAPPQSSQQQQQQQYAPAALAPQDTYSFGPAHASVPGTPVSDTPSFLLGPSAAPPPPPPLPERSGSAGNLLSARSSSVRSQPPPPPPPPPPSAAPPLQSQRSFAQQPTLVEVHHPPPAAAMTEARSVSPQGPPPPPSAAVPLPSATNDSQQQQPQSSAPQRMGSLIRAFERPVEQEPGVYDDVSRSSSIQQPPGAAPPGKVLVKRRVSKPKLPTAMMSSDGGEALDLSPTTRPRTIPPPPPSAAVVAAVKPPPRVVKEPVVEDSALPKVDNVRAKIEEKEKERAKEKEAEELAEEKYFSKKYKKPSNSLSPVRSNVATTEGKRPSTDAGSSSTTNTVPLVLPATGGDLVQSPSHAMTKSASFSNGTTPRGVASGPPRSNGSSAYTVTFSAVFSRQCDADKFRKMSLNDRRNVIDAALAQSLFDAVSGPVANLSDVTVSMDVMDDEEEEGQWRGCLSMCGQIDHIASSADRRLVVRLLTCTFQNPDVFATAMHPLMGSPPPPSSNGTSSSSSSLCSLEQALINDVEVVGRNAPSTASLADSPPANAANKLGVIQPVQMSRQQAPEGGEGFGRSLSATSSEALRQYELRKRLVSSSYRGYVPMTTPCRDAVPAATDYQYHPTLTSEHPYPSQAAFQMIDRQQQSSLSAAAAARQTPDRYLQRSIYAKGTAPTVAAAAAAPVASYAHLNNSSNAYATQQQYSQQYRNPSEESSLSFTPNLTSYRTRRYQTF